MRLALYQPDIAQNTGTILRLAACFALEAHIVEPAGFPTSDRAFRRAGMDYLDQVQLVRHVSWAAFDAWRREHALRLVLLTTRAERSYLDHRFAENDVLLFGRESAGVPEEVHAAADARLLICDGGCARSTWRWPAPWRWARRCARRAGWRRGIANHLTDFAWSYRLKNVTGTAWACTLP